MCARWIPIFCLLVGFLGCQEATPPTPIQPSLLLDERDVTDFANQIDNPEVRSLLAGGQATGVIGIANEGRADIDIIRIVSTAGKLVQVSLEPGSGVGADFRPFLFVSDAQGELFGLENGEELQLAQVPVLVPRNAEMFAVITDARNQKGTGVVGGNALDYTLRTTEETLQPIDLGSFSPLGILTQTGTLPPGKGTAFFSFRAPAGTRVSISVRSVPVTNSQFVPFFAVYSSSFDLGLTAFATSPREPIERTFVVFSNEPEEEVVVAVSDFFGLTGADFVFEIRVVFGF